MFPILSENSFVVKGEDGPQLESISRENQLILVEIVSNNAVYQSYL